MALERKDVRFKLDEQDHAALKAICDVAGLDVGEFVESRTGIVGRNREDQGTSWRGR